MSMNLNTDFFAAYQFRQRQAKVVYQLPLKKPQQSSTNTPWSMENSHGNESFLPSIKTVQRLDDGYRPYRRNDFANNHLFVAKQKLARVFLDQPTVDVRSTEELVHLFDEHDSKQRNRKVYRRKPSESSLRMNPSLDQHTHLTVINLAIKPSFDSSQTRDPMVTLSDSRASMTHAPPKAPRGSMEWINPVHQRAFSSTSTDSLASKSIYSDDLTFPSVRSVLPTIGPTRSRR